MFKRLGMGLALAVLSLALVACGGNDDDNKDEPAAPSVVTGGQLSDLINEAGADSLPKYGDTAAILVKGLADADYTAGGESETKFAMKLFPANNNGQVTIDVTSTDATVDATALALVTAKYTGGNLVISFGAGIDGTEIEGKVLQATAKVGEKSLFVLNFKVVAADAFIAPIVEGFTVADSKPEANKDDVVVQTIVLGAKDAADLNKGYAEGSHSFALTLTGTGAYLGAKVSRVEGDSFNTKVVVDGDDYAVVISTDQVDKSATYSIAPVAPEEVDGDPLPAVFVKVKSVGPVPKVTVANVEITEEDGTANAVITFLPAALTEGTAEYDTTKFDLFAVSSDEDIATVAVTNVKGDTGADAIVVTEASGETSKATVTVYVVPVDATNATNAHSSTTFEVSVALDPITAVDDANAILKDGYEAILPLNKGGVDAAATDAIVATVTLKGETETPNGITATAGTVGTDGAFTGTENGIYNGSTHLAVTLPDAGTDFDNIEADQVYVVTVQVMTGATPAVERSSSTFELTIKPIATVTADDVRIEVATGKTATATLVKTDYDVDPAFYNLSVSVTATTGGTATTDISVALVDAAGADAGTDAAKIDAATGVKITVGANALAVGAVYTVTISVLDSTDSEQELSSSTFTVTATAPNVVAEDLSIPLAKGSTVTAPITKEFYDAATHSLEVAVTDPDPNTNTDLTVALVNGDSDAAAGGDDATGVKITVGDAALTAGDVYTVTLTVKAGSDEVSTRTFKVVAASADDLKATVTAADVDLKKDATSVLTLPVVKTDYVAAKHSLSVAVTDAAGTGAAVGDITATLDPAGDDATAVKLVVAKELVGVYTVTLTVVLEGTEVVVSTHDITVTAAAESTVTAAANVANAATDIAKASGTILTLPLVKVGSGTTVDSTLTATIAGGTDGDITVDLLTANNFRTEAKTYATATRIELVTKKALEAGDVYTVTLTIGDGAQTPATIGTPTTFTVTAVDAVTATAVNVAIDKAIGETATATLTKTDYAAATHDLLVAVTDAVRADGTTAIAAEDYKMVPAVAKDGDAVTLTVDDVTALTAGDVYTVTIYVVEEGTTATGEPAVIPADKTISTSTFTVTAVDAATLEATATAAAAADLEVSKTIDVALTKADYDTDKHDIVATVTKATGSVDPLTTPALTDLALTVDEGTAGLTDDAKITVTAAADVTLVVGDKYTVTIDVVLEGTTTVISSSDVVITIDADTVD